MRRVMSWLLTLLALVAVVLGLAERFALLRPPVPAATPSPQPQARASPGASREAPPGAPLEMRPERLSRYGPERLMSLVEGVS